MARSKNPVWFGIHSRGLSYERLVPVAKAAEAAGFVSMAFADRPPESNLEGWTIATAVAVQTERLMVTHSTLNVPYRNPALLAKMAATLDFITGGRLLLTLGAGGQEGHATAYGMTFGTPGERYQDLKDAIAIMHGLWENEIFDYQGAPVQCGVSVGRPQAGKRVCSYHYWSRKAPNAEARRRRGGRLDQEWGLG